MEREEREQWMDKVLIFMNDQMESTGSTLGSIHFNFEEGAEDAEEFIQQHSILLGDLKAILNICFARKYIKHHSIGREFNQLGLTEEGQARAISVQNADSKKVAQANTIHIGTLNTHAPTQIGNYNRQDIQHVFNALEQAIDAAMASEEEKQEAKSRLKKFLEHPLTNTILGSGLGLAGSLLG